jgi:tartrate-resistant acid phosphatase type 5
MHHPPYSAGPHQSSVDLRWPFKEWGATIVFAGHDHDYERLEADGLTYVVNGVGGAELYPLGEALPETVVQYDQSFGAIVVDTTGDGLRARFYAVDGRLVDDALVPSPAASAAP